MSALAHESPPPYDPYHLRPDEGPQTVPQLRAALAALDPAALSEFNAAYEGARLGCADAIVSEYRHVWALRARAEVTAAVAASLAGHPGELIDAADIMARYPADDAA
ncbi:hypothetical protein [Streptomyces chrestomyceticus]|uniref:hypothetical protein n=1 Tax=Streptomyces chrestomyceticus TaxID=68185 RepID=UPI0033DCFF88